MVIVHTNGDKEKVAVSESIALAFIKRLLEDGWPFCTVEVPDGRWITKQGSAFNAFILNTGEEIVF